MQQVQDGCNLPRTRRKNAAEGSCAQKFILAFDFSRAYETVDHQLLKMRLLEQGPARLHHLDMAVPERSAGTSGAERTFSDVRAFLPQGSVLSPILFLL